MSSGHELDLQIGVLGRGLLQVTPEAVAVGRHQLLVRPGINGGAGNDQNRTLDLLVAGKQV